MKRYPFNRLAAVMGLTENACGEALGVTGSQLQEYRSRGLTDYQADRLSILAGEHPFVVWPELLEDRVERYVRTCVACSQPFVAGMDGARRHYCSTDCYAHEKRKRDQHYGKAEACLS